MIAPRLTGVLTLFILVLLYLLFPLHRSRPAVIITCVIFFTCGLLPADIDIAGYHGPIFGTKSSGLRFVRMVKGMPKTDQCIAKYGEFVAGGCGVNGYDPIWILEWER